MGISQKLVLSAFAVTVVAGLSACSSWYPDHAVREAYGCTGPNAAETCKYPTYEGNIQVDGVAVPFPHYRDTPAGREFYVNGAWRKADPGTPFGRV